jgi:predicted metal-binding membrane protein
VIERLLRHERGLVLAGVVAVAALAWFDLWRRARGMMDMAMPAMEPWSFAEFGAILAMWLVMMVAMMLPSAAPMLLLFAGTQRGRAATRHSSTLVAFASGYLLVWAGFSVAAAALQGVLQQRMLLSSDLAMTSRWLGGRADEFAGPPRRSSTQGSAPPRPGRRRGGGAWSAQVRLA